MMTNSGLRRIQGVLADLLYGIFNGFLTGVRMILFGRKLPQDPKTILILRSGHLGDTLCAIPALIGIRDRFPGARRILMTNSTDGTLPFPKEVLDKIVDFDEVMTYDPNQIGNLTYLKNLSTKIQNEKIDLFIYLGQSIATPWRILRDMIFFKVAGCKSAVGFRVDTHRFFVLGQRFNRRFLQEPVRLLELLKPLGVSFDGHWPIPTGATSLDERVGGPRVAIHPWAKYPVKRWPLELFIEVASDLQKKYKAQIVLIGGADTTESGRLIREKLGHGVIDFTGKTNFLETAEVLRQCDFLLSNDSGPVHLAAAVKTPVVGIYSARDFPNAWYPSGSSHEVLRKDVECQICYLETCPIMICINQISSEDVLNACERILKKTGGYR